MYLFSCDLLPVLSLASSLGSLMVSDSTELYLIWVQQKGLFKYKLCEWQHIGSMCEKMNVWKWLVSGAGWEEVTACPVHNPCTPQTGTLPPRPGLWAGGELQTREQRVKSLSSQETSLAALPHTQSLVLIGNNSGSLLAVLCWFRAQV